MNITLLQTLTLAAKSLLFFMLAGGASVAILLAYLGKLKSTLYFITGHIENDELTKFSLLSLCFSFIIGAHWGIRSMKEAILLNTWGSAEILPKLKLLSPLALFIVLLVYGYLIPKVSKQTIFYIVCWFYGLFFASLAILLKLAQNITLTHHSIIGNALAWAYFLGAETFGGLIVGAVFWAFVHSITTTTSAKKGYPLIFIGGQLGAIVSTLSVTAYAETLGIENITIGLSTIIAIVPTIISLVIRQTPSHLMKAEHEATANQQEASSGILGGLKLIASDPFLLGVLIISALHETIGAIIDFQFKTIANNLFSREQFASFMALFGSCSNFVALTFMIFGTGFFIRTLGIRSCLILYPILVSAAICGVWLSPSLLTFFAAMLLIKAVSHALNNPAKEFLYLPTSEEVKFKAKGFIDGLGVKGFKALGNTINNFLANNPAMLLNLGSAISLAITAGWILVASAIGKSYEKMMKEDLDTKKD